jgi:RNA polymerase-interacting CarD/CdnL/TRCF family regulator
MSPLALPVATPAFKVGDTVFLASAGLGHVSAYAARDAAGRPAPLAPGAAPAFYVVDVDQTVACVPFSASEPLRAPVDPLTAGQMLEVLRAQEPPASAPEPLLERGKRVVHSGSPLEHAQLLRELYALPIPLAEAFASGVTFLSKLVLPEVAAVAGLDAAALGEEMRGRYPAAQDAEDAAKLLRFHR